MNNSIKKIIAREGLILVGIVLAVRIITSFTFTMTWEGYKYIDNFLPYAFACVFLWVVIRFIIWAFNVLGITARLKRDYHLRNKWIHIIGLFSVGMFVLGAVFSVQGVGLWLSLLTLTIAYLIYLIVKLFIWGIKKRIYAKKIDKKIFVREGLVIIACLMIIIVADNITIQFNKPFDLAGGLSAIQLDDGKLQWDIFTSEGKVNEIDRKTIQDHWLHKDITGMSNQQIIAELNQHLTMVRERRKKNEIFSAVLRIIGFILYPVYLLIRLILWVIRILREQ